MLALLEFCVADFSEKEREGPKPLPCFVQANCLLGRLCLVFSRCCGPRERQVNVQTFAVVFSLSGGIVRFLASKLSG